VFRWTANDKRGRRLVSASCFTAFSACVNTAAFWITLHALPLGYQEVASTDPVAAWLKSESFRLGYMHEALILPVLFIMYYAAPRPIYSVGIACTFGLDALHDFLLTNMSVTLPVIFVYTPLLLAWGAGAAEYALALATSSAYQKSGFPPRRRNPHAPPNESKGPQTRVASSHPTGTAPLSRLKQTLKLSSTEKPHLEDAKP